jgi:hypothetical protein
MIQNFKSAIREVAIDLKSVFERPQFIGKFLRQHIFYLIWILLVPILLYSMAQGRELFVGLFDDSMFFTGIRGAGLLFAYFLMSMVVYLLPLPFYRRLPESEWALLRPATLNDPGLQYFLAILPSLLYGMLMIAIQAHRINNWWEWVLIGLTLVLALVLSYIFEAKWRFSIPVTLLFMSANILLCAIGLLPEKKDAFWNYFIVGGFLMIQTMLTGGLTKRLHEAAKTAMGLARTTGPVRRWGAYDYLYIGVNAALVIFMVICIASPNLEGFSPIYMLLMLTSFYLLMSNWVSTLYMFHLRQRSVWLKWALLVVLAGLVMLVFSWRAPIHDVRTTTSPVKADQRRDFNSWFEVWSKANLLPDTSGTGEIPIYLMAIQGGGSRAGLWASSVLNELEVRSQYRFHRHCLAISSASGGSSGTGATLALWRYAADSSAMLARLDSVRRNKLFCNFAAGMYQRNYLSGSFFELLVVEVGMSALYKSRLRRDRNYRLQTDEALGFAAGLRNGLYDKPSTSINKMSERISALQQRGDRPLLTVYNGEKVRNYPFEPYLSYWYDAKGQPKPELPLYFPITTHIQTGRGGFSSPVQMEEALFPAGIDMLKVVELSDTTRHPSLSMVGASHFSQLFPLLNAFTFVPGTGNFVDGGLVENMGLTAMLEIYRRTDSLARNVPWLAGCRDRIKIHFVLVTNDLVTEKDITGHESVWQPSALFSFIGTAAIHGRTHYFSQKAAQTVKAPDQLHELWLQTLDTPDEERAPLGRWLSTRTLKMTSDTIVKYDKALNQLTAPLRKK